MRTIRALDPRPLPQPILFFIDKHPGTEENVKTRPESMVG